GATFDDLDPFTGDVVARVPAGGRGDAASAIGAAAAAFPAWSQSAPAERQRIFLKAADILESRQDEVVGLLARETGCTFGFGMFQMHFVPNLLRQAAALPYQPVGQVIPSDNPGTFALGIRRPAGVVGAIAPWNAALIISARSIADEFVPRLAEKTKTLKTGDPKEPDTIIGPLITEHALANVKTRVEDAVAKGAKVLAGGDAVGACYQATLLTDVPEDSD